MACLAPNVSESNANHLPRIKYRGITALHTMDPGRSELLDYITICAITARFAPPGFGDIGYFHFDLVLLLLAVLQKVQTDWMGESAKHESPNGRRC